jgi:carboxymethylenebutenolidase
MLTRDVDLGYLALPERQGQSSVPGVVMIHDVWGLYDHYRDLARRLAGEGFGVLALDLYRRHAEVKIEDPGAWIRGLSDPEVQSDVEAAAAFLAREPATRGRKVAVVGFCMGGMYALLAGCSAHGISAVVPFYGLLSHSHGLLHSELGLDPERKPRSPLAAAADLQCPLLGFFGAEDNFVPPDDVRELERRTAESGQNVEVVSYPGAGHAFMNDTREEAYRPEAARDAWQRMLVFLRNQLE